MDKIENIILSGDADVFQLVNDRTKVYFLKNKSKDAILYNEEAVKEKYQGLSPEQLIDLKALQGDSSDNIPGVPGIGQKTAFRLIKKFGNLKNLYSNLNKADKSLQKKIRGSSEKAFFSRKLIEIKKDVSIDFKLEECGWKSYNKEKVTLALKNLGLIKLIEKLPKLNNKKVDCQKKLF